MIYKVMCIFVRERERKRMKNVLAGVAGMPGFPRLWQNWKFKNQGILTESLRS